MKFTVDEITELVKITKQEIAALATSSNEIGNVCVIDRQLGLQVFCFNMSKTYTFRKSMHLRNIAAILYPTNTTQFCI